MAPSFELPWNPRSGSRPGPVTLRVELDPIEPEPSKFGLGAPGERFGPKSPDLVGVYLDAGRGTSDPHADPTETLVAKPTLSPLDPGESFDRDRVAVSDP
jgi:hypothetical protein